MTKSAIALRGQNDGWHFAHSASSGVPDFQDKAASTELSRKFLSQNHP
jgi:hypothetical protein